MLSYVNCALPYLEPASNVTYSRGDLGNTFYAVNNFEPQIVSIRIYIYKERLISDCYKFHQYQQNDQLPFILTSLIGRGTGTQMWRALPS